MNQREYEKLRQKIQKEADEKLRALDIVWSLLNESESDKGQDVSVPNSTDISTYAATFRQKDIPSGRGRTKRIRIAQEVKKAIKEVDEEFDQQDISDIIEANNPGIELHRGSVSNAIARMVDREEKVDGMHIELAERGSGSVPNVYRKVKDTSFPDDMEMEDETYEDDNDEEIDPIDF